MHVSMKDQSTNIPCLARMPVAPSPRQSRLGLGAGKDRAGLARDEQPVGSGFRLLVDPSRAKSDGISLEGRNHSASHVFLRDIHRSKNCSYCLYASLICLDNVLALLERSSDHSSPLSQPSSSTGTWHIRSR